MAVLVVTIDTEEEGRWSSDFPSQGNTCVNIGRLERVHRIFERLGVVPTYLVDYPVAIDDAAREVLCSFMARGRVEIGAHLHPWCNPPFFPKAERRNRETYPHNLPENVQRAKLETLIGTIKTRFGVRPTSYRAGRWGFDHTTVPVLESLGIAVDSSVTPLWWDTDEGGASFSRAPQNPYYLSRRDVCSPGSSTVVEVPMSNLVAAPLGSTVERLVRFAGPAPGFRRLMVSLGFRSLRPEQFALEDMVIAAEAIARRGLEVFNVMFHSSIALPGATPYALDEKGLDAFCGRLEGILEHILERHGAEPVGLSQVPEHIGSLRSQKVA